MLVSNLYSHILNNSEIVQFPEVYMVVFFHSSSLSSFEQLKIKQHGQQIITWLFTTVYENTKLKHPPCFLSLNKTLILDCVFTIELQIPKNWDLSYLKKKTGPTNINKS